MQPDSIRVLSWGLGPVGMAMARLVWRRAGLVPVGAVDLDAGRIGKDLGDLAGFGEKWGVEVSGDPSAALAAARPDVTLLETEEGLTALTPHILQAMEAGSNIICLAPEMGYPWATDPRTAERLDDQAHAHGVTVLGIGMHPGFLLDASILALTGCCADVERIRAARTTDFSRMDKQMLRRLGVGLSPSDFAERRADVERSPVSGLEQAIYLLADSLGWKLGRVTHERSAIVAGQRREAADLAVEPGQVAGILYTAVGEVEGRPRILLDHACEVDPSAEETKRFDWMDIEGIPSMRVELSPPLGAETAAPALAVNLIAPVLLSGPGLKTVADMPVPHAVLGDVREDLAGAGRSVEEELGRGWHEPDLAGSPVQGSDGLQANP